MRARESASGKSTDDEEQKDSEREKNKAKQRKTEQDRKKQSKREKDRKTERQRKRKRRAHTIELVRAEGDGLAENHRHFLELFGVARDKRDRARELHPHAGDRHAAASQPSRAGPQTTSTAALFHCFLAQVEIGEGGRSRGSRNWQQATNQANMCESIQDFLGCVPWIPLLLGVRVPNHLSGLCSYFLAQFRPSVRPSRPRGRSWHLPRSLPSLPFGCERLMRVAECTKGHSRGYQCQNYLK